LAIEDLDIEEIFDREVPFEQDYQDAKENNNVIWDKYQDKIFNTINGLSYWKNFDKDELIQQSYLYFSELCNRYNPYYAGNFIPFNKYLFKNIIIKLRAFIQRYYFKRKREQPTEISDYMFNYMNNNDVSKSDLKIHVEYLYSLITNRQKQILELSLKGYKQQEIGEILDISQSRVSVIKKKTLQKLQKVMEKRKEK
jgi:RNA polymerase sigma factor (sigma-70 family)